MKLKQVETHLREAFGDELARRIDEHADDHAMRIDRLADFARALARDTSRTRCIKIQPNQVGAELDRGARVFDARHAADFYAHAHRTSSRAASNSGNFAAGLPSRSRLSPIRNARAPAASRRRMSSGALMPLSATISASPR